MTFCQGAILKKISKIVR